MMTGEKVISIERRHEIDRQPDRTEQTRMLLEDLLRSTKPGSGAAFMRSLTENDNHLCEQLFHQMSEKNNLGLKPEEATSATRPGDVVLLS